MLKFICDCTIIACVFVGLAVLAASMLGLLVSILYDLFDPYRRRY